MTPTIIRKSADRKTIIKAQRISYYDPENYFIVQSTAFAGQCVERFETLAEAEAFFMKITSQDLS